MKVLSNELESPLNIHRCPWLPNQPCEAWHTIFDTCACVVELTWPCLRASCTAYSARANASSHMSMWVQCFRDALDHGICSQ